MQSLEPATQSSELTQWQSRASKGLHTAWLQPPVTRLTHPEVLLLTVACHRSQPPLSPLLEARERVETLLDANTPLLDLAAERVKSGLRRRLLGDEHPLRSDAGLSEALQRLARQTSRPCVLVFEALEQADTGTLEVLHHLLARPGASPVALVLVFRSCPLPPEAQLLLQTLENVAGPEAVLGRAETPAPLPTSPTQEAQSTSAVKDMTESSGEVPVEVVSKATGIPASPETLLSSPSPTTPALPTPASRTAELSSEPAHTPLSTSPSPVVPTSDAEVHEAVVLPPRLPSLAPPVLRVLRAAALIGERFEVSLVASLLELPPLSVLELLQDAYDAGVALEDLGEGRLVLSPGWVERLQHGMLPSLKIAWHRRLGALLSPPASPLAMPEPAEPSGAEAQVVVRPEASSEKSSEPSPEPSSEPSSEPSPEPSSEPSPEPSSVPHSEPRSETPAAAKVPEPTEQDTRPSAPELSAKAADADFSVEAPAPDGIAPAREETQASTASHAHDPHAHDPHAHDPQAHHTHAHDPHAEQQPSRSEPTSHSELPDESRIEADLRRQEAILREIEAHRRARQQSRPEPRAEEQATEALQEPGTLRSGTSGSRRPSAAPAGRPGGQAGSPPPSPLRSEPARAADHFSASGELDKAAESYLNAAEQAARVGAQLQAIPYVQQALHLLDRLPQSESRRILRIRALLDLSRYGWEVAGQGRQFSLKGVIERLEQALQLLREADPPVLRAEVHALLANVCYDLGDRAGLDRALEELTQASRILQEAGDPAGAARYLNDQAAVWVRLGDPVRAHYLLTESRKVFESRASSDKVAAEELAETDHLLARLTFHVPARPGREGDAIAVGLKHAQAAENAYRQLKNTRELARVWETIARLESMNHQEQRALERLQQALTVQQQLRDVLGLARTAGALAELLASRGETLQALQLLSESVALNADKGSVQGLSANRQGLEKIQGFLQRQAQEGKLPARTWQAQQELLRRLSLQLEQAQQRLKLRG